MIIARLLTPDDAIVTETTLDVITPTISIPRATYKSLHRTHPSRESAMEASGIEKIEFHYSPLETELYNMLTEDDNVIVIYRQENWS